MIDIIKQTLAAIPQYLIEFFNLLFSPREFPISRLPKYESEKRDKLVDALKFALISYVIILILVAQKIKQDTVMVDLGTAAISTLIMISLFAGAVFFSWRIFGSKIEFSQYFIIYSYQYGIVFIIISLFSIMSDGYLRISDLSLYEGLLKSKETGKFDNHWLDNRNLWIAWAIIGLGYLLGMIWLNIGWGAYRIINNAKRPRSFAVFMTAGFFSWLAFALTYMITNGIKK